MKILFKLAQKEDIDQLTAVSIKSFHSDTIAGANELKGPPGYKSKTFHHQMLDEASFFFKILDHDKIIGGFWIITREDQKAYIYRIFIDPDYHQKGIGLKSFEFLFEEFNKIKEWTIRTPTWNTRTPRLYQKLGFEITDKSDQFLHFIKKTG